MNKYQVWYLVGLYFYVNMYMTIYLYRKDDKDFIKKLFLLWLVPIIGYVIISFLSIKKDFWNKIINFILIIMIYFIIYVFVSYN